MTQKLKQQKNLKKSNERENKSLRTKKKRKQKKLKNNTKSIFKTEFRFFLFRVSRKIKINSSDLKT